MRRVVVYANTKLEFEFGDLTHGSFRDALVCSLLSPTRQKEGFFDCFALQIAYYLGVQTSSALTRKHNERLADLVITAK